MLMFVAICLRLLSVCSWAARIATNDVILLSNPRYSQSEMHHDSTNEVNNDVVSLQLVGSEQLRMSHVPKFFFFTYVSTMSSFFFEFGLHGR